MNTPIFRAKKIDSDKYVEGFYIEDYGVASYIQGSKYLNFIVSDRGEKGMEVDTLFQIDPTTLAIHFENMIDIEGDKIFASLQDFGKGGDIITDGEYDFVVIFNGRGFDLMFVEDNTFAKFNEWDDWNKFTKKGAKK